MMLIKNIPPIPLERHLEAVEIDSFDFWKIIHNRLRHDYNLPYNVQKYL